MEDYHNTASNYISIAVISCRDEVVLNCHRNLGRTNIKKTAGGREREGGGT